MQGEPPARRQCLIIPAHHMFAAILTKTLLSYGGIPPMQCYRFGPVAPTDCAGGTYVRGSTTDKNAIDSVLKNAKIDIVIHLLLRNAEALISENQTENEVYDENVRDTNALLQALTRRQRQHDPIKTILVSGIRLKHVDDILGNTISAAEALWFGRAVRQEWQSVVVRAAFSDSPWDCAFVEWCYGIWDLGIHPHDLADAIAGIVDKLTNKVGITYPLILRGKALEIQNVNQGVKNITQSEKVIMQKYGLELEGKYEEDDNHEDQVQVQVQEAQEQDNGDSSGSRCNYEGKEGKKEDEIVEARRVLLGQWKPQYRKREVLADLQKYGYKGPPEPSWLIKKISNTFSNSDGVTAVHFGNFD